MDVGWFGIPGAPSSKATKTHAVMYCGNLLCGLQVNPKSEFQRCWAGLNLRDAALVVECMNCKKIAFVRNGKQTSKRG